jgi:hypothetical protein
MRVLCGYPRVRWHDWLEISPEVKTQPCVQLQLENVFVGKPLVQILRATTTVQSKWLRTLVAHSHDTARLWAGGGQPFLNPKNGECPEWRSLDIEVNSREFEGPYFKLKVVALEQRVDPFNDFALKYR